jgi:hypothetical protein
MFLFEIVTLLLPANHNTIEKIKGIYVPKQQFSFWEISHAGAASKRRKALARCHSHRSPTTR